MTSPPLHRPTLLPGLFRTWRDAHTLQLGLRPDAAVLIDEPELATLLRNLKVPAAEPPANA